MTGPSSMPSTAASTNGPRMPYSTWNLRSAAYAAVVVAVTSLILKFTWYDRLQYT